MWKLHEFSLKRTFHGVLILTKVKGTTQHDPGYAAELIQTNENKQQFSSALSLPNGSQWISTPQLHPPLPIALRQYPRIHLLDHHQGGVLRWTPGRRHCWKVSFPSLASFFFNFAETSTAGVSLCHGRLSTIRIHSMKFSMLTFDFTNSTTRRFWQIILCKIAHKFSVFLKSFTTFAKVPAPVSLKCLLVIGQSRPTPVWRRERIACFMNMEHWKYTNDKKIFICLERLECFECFQQKLKDGHRRYDIYLQCYPYVDASALCSSNETLLFLHYIPNHCGKDRLPLNAIGSRHQMTLECQILKLFVEFNNSSASSKNAMKNCFFCRFMKFEMFSPGSTLEHKWLIRSRLHTCNTLNTSNQELTIHIVKGSLVAKLPIYGRHRKIKEQ